MSALHGRLLAVEKLCKTGETVIDVGCDHGYLSLALLKSKAFQRAVLCDINEKPLLSARNTFSGENLRFDAEFVCTDGLSGITCNGDFTVCICGMGGELILDIINKDLNFGNRLSERASRLILQPMSRPEALRRFLFENGFEIDSECAVCETDKVYIIMSAHYSGCCCTVRMFDAELGVGIPYGDCVDYYDRLRNAYSAIKEGKAKAGLSTDFEEKILAEISYRTVRSEKT